MSVHGGRRGRGGCPGDARGRVAGRFAPEAARAELIRLHRDLDALRLVHAALAEDHLHDDLESLRRRQAARLMRAPWTGSGTFTPGDLIAVVAESKTLSFGAAQRGGRARDARADRGGAVAGKRGRGQCFRSSSDPAPSHDGLTDRGGDRRRRGSRVRSESALSRRRAWRQGAAAEGSEAPGAGPRWR
jgi:hypothetical protein